MRDRETDILAFGISIYVIISRDHIALLHGESPVEAITFNEILQEKCNLL